MAQWTPQIQPATVEVKSVQKVVNYPKDGTKLRLTKGETVIYGTVNSFSRDDEYSCFGFDIDGIGKYSNFLVWLESEWEIEILAEPTEDEL